MYLSHHASQSFLCVFFFFGQDLRFQTIDLDSLKVSKRQPTKTLKENHAKRLDEKFGCYHGDEEQDKGTKPTMSASKRVQI